MCLLQRACTDGQQASSSAIDDASVKKEVGERLTTYPWVIIPGRAVVVVIDVTTIVCYSTKMNASNTIIARPHRRPCPIVLWIHGTAKPRVEQSRRVMLSVSEGTATRFVSRSCHAFEAAPQYNRGTDVTWEIFQVTETQNTQGVRPTVKHQRRRLLDLWAGVDEDAIDAPRWPL